MAEGIAMSMTQFEGYIGPVLERVNRPPNCLFVVDTESNADRHSATLAVDKYSRLSR